mgnify:CR=1 FL=1
MRKVQLYINNQLVDLFGDEKIEITSSIQNIQDISKVYTDFSKSFTVPCSDNNNAIFDFFYNNDVDGTFQYQERATARIEINNAPFRRGKIQLESAEIKNNKPESYKVTFFGDIVSIKDLFADDKLADLDYSTIDFTYTGDTIKNTITNSDTSLNVRFPLISSNRVWQHGDSSSNDISVSANPIVYTELFPAIKDKSIMDIIQTKYGITFDSDFFDGDYFNNSFTYWKNSKNVIFTAAPNSLEFLNYPSGPYTPGQAGVVNLQHIAPSATALSANGSNYFTIRFTFTTTPTADFFIDTYRNGILDNTMDSAVTVPIVAGVYQLAFVTNIPTLNDVYTFAVRTYNMSASTVVGGTITVEHKFDDLNASGSVFLNSSTPFITALGSQTSDINYNFETTAPDITVSDWFAGVLNMFNLTCYPIETATNYKVEPLMAWYLHGGEINITEYTDTKSIKIDRPKLHNLISFEYAQSKAFLNEEFRGRLGYNYGDLSLAFNYDGKPFKIKLPFENMQFTKFTGTNLQVSYAVDNAVGGNSYIPKPVKLFLDELQNTDVSFYFNNGVGTVSQITQYMPFGQDQVYNTMDCTQNFGLETSTLKDYEISLSLYAIFYQAYLSNLFDNKTRKVTVKCHLPLPVLTMLTLDDSIILRDKRYSIQTMTTDLTTGEVSLVLLSDFNRGFLPTIPDIPSDPITGPKSIALPIKMIKPPNPTKQFGGGGGYITLSATVETSFITLAIKGGAVTLPLTLTADTILDIDIARNTTGSARNQTIPVTYYDASGTVINTTFIFLQQV